MEDFFDRLDKFMKAKDLNDNQLTVNAGLSIGSLGKQRQGSRGLSNNSIAKILCSYPDLSADWLLTGKEPMLRSQVTPGDQEERVVAVNTVTLAVLRSKMIPHVEAWAVAGFGSANFAIQESDVKDYYVIPRFKDRTIDFMIEVSGSSMYPKYGAGDIVACTILRESRFIQWNKVHVIGTKEQGILIKRVKEGKSESQLLLVSDNQDYDPFTISTDEITGMAIVVGVIRLE